MSLAMQLAIIIMQLGCISIQLTIIVKLLQSK